MTRFERQRRQMVRQQIEARGLDGDALLRAFGQVPREVFVPADLEPMAYEDRPLPIGEGQTISQPYIVALMLDAAAITPGDKVLEVGAGSGYAAAVASRLARLVIAMERHADLARDASRRIAALGYDNCTIRAGDGLAGFPEEAPFDAILVAARAGRVPEALKRQLAPGGRLVIPVGPKERQQLTVITREGEDLWSTREIAEVRFVPLVSGLVAGDHNGSNGTHTLTTPALIARLATPLPAPDSPDFAEAFDRFADKRVVMLGECSHGTSEFYEARAAITQRLVDQHGFRIVAVEGDWPDCAAYDRIVRGLSPADGTPAPFTRFPDWMWRNTVMPGFLGALREINQKREPDDLARFYGLDIYNMHAAIAAVLDYLDRHDPQAAAIARQRYACLEPWQSQPAAYGRDAIKSGFAACEAAAIAQCRAMLDRALAANGEAFGAAMNARLVAAAERYYRVMYYGGPQSWNLRDRHMAETLRFLFDHHGPDAKAVVWAHNSHIGDARATDMGSMRGEHNLGQLARQRWGDDVALIGFGTHTGTVSAASDWDGPREEKAINPSHPQSFDNLCHDSGIARFLLDLRDPAIVERLGGAMLQRFIGVIYRPETERWSHYSEAAPARQFDAYCWFDRTRALQPLPAAQLQEGEADSFPFGV